MEEQIKNIFHKHGVCYLYPEGIKTIEEITSMVMEYCKWIGNNELYRNKGKNGKWLFENEPYITWKSDNELFQYWFDNIKNK